VKRGARGASAYEGGRRVDVSALEVDVKDAVGAGDTFDAGFLHQWVRKAPLETCVAYGNLVGGYPSRAPAAQELSPILPTARVS
jgi:sugar/nucleoside kinase (ribokinase family)